MTHTLPTILLKYKLYFIKLNLYLYKSNLCFIKYNLYFKNAYGSGIQKTLRMTLWGRAEGLVFVVG